jgi:tetratricopeptide (TPR) repeat protein
MHRLIKELRRREVFRTAGLYVGIAWIVVEVSSVLFDAFDAPEWALQAVIMLAVIGLPVTVVLAWVFDITEKGIEVQADATDTTVIPFGGRRMDFVVIGVLSVALIFSVYLNIANKSETVDGALEPLSILIADFENQTGDPLFEGSLEQALQIGLEAAPFVSSYERGMAVKVAQELRSTDKLDSDVAQLVATREGIKLVLAGSIVPDGGKYDLFVSAIVPRSGEIVAEADMTAGSKLEVLAAMGELAANLREELGDKSVNRDEFEITETFTSMSLEAAREYDTAQQLQYQAKFTEAIEHYRKAVEEDPNFGRAYSGWAVAARSLGRVEEASGAMDKAMANLGSMTERERLRTQGIYYWGVTRNFQKAIETYELLIERYPADFVGRNNVAVVKFFALDFVGAREEGEKAVEIYPRNATARSNYALYAMYSSDFGTAVAEAAEARELDPSYFAVWLPSAMQALENNDIEGANQAYANMAEGSVYGASVAALGLADVALFSGDHAEAGRILAEGVGRDAGMKNNYGMAVKQVALAEALLAQGDVAGAVAAAGKGVELVSTDATLVPAAFIYLGAGESEKVTEVADALAGKLSPQSRAYAGMLQGLLALQDGDPLAAIDAITKAQAIADLWLIRFHLGRAYFEGGFFVEALDEFTIAVDRHGEATAAFLDDLPTYHYTATVPYWRGRAQAELGKNADAAINLEKFIASRPAGGPLADDARQRLP